MAERRRAHIDTDILRAALGADDDEDRVSGARAFLHRSVKPLVACASIPVLGELVLTLTTADACTAKDFLDFMGALHGHISEGRLVTFGLGAEWANVFQVAADIRRADERLQPTDSIIVACLFEDPLADILYTTDPEIIESTVVQARARDCGKHVREFGGE